MPNKVSEQKRSCYACHHQSLCYLKRSVYDALVPQAAWMLENAPRPWTDMFDVLAECCGQYVSDRPQLEVPSEICPECGEEGPCGCGFIPF